MIYFKQNVTTCFNDCCNAKLSMHVVIRTETRELLNKSSWILIFESSADICWRVLIFLDHFTWISVCVTGVRGGAVRWGTALQVGRSRVRFPMVSLRIIHRHNPSSRTMALGSTQPLTEMSTRNISCGVKEAGAWVWQPYHLHVPTVLESGSLTLLEPSGSPQACKVIAFCLNIYY